MKVRRVWLAAILILVLAVPAVSATPAPIHHTYNWAGTLVGKNVSLGSDIKVLVFGPPNGTFNISVEGQPFNHTFPILSQAFSLPNKTTNSTTGASMLVSIPTPQKEFTYGGYEIRMENTTDAMPFGYFDVTLVSPVNDTKLASNVAVLWLYLNISLARERSLLNQQGLLENQVEELFWVVIGAVILNVAIVTITRSPVSRTRFAKAVRRGFHGAFYENNDSDPWSADSGLPNEIPVVDPTRIWVSRLYPDCDECSIPTSQSEKILHLKKAHRLAAPIFPRDYEKFDDAIKMAVSKRTDSQPSPRKLREELAEFPKDYFAGFPGQGGK